MSERRLGQDNIISQETAVPGKRGSRRLVPIVPGAEIKEGQPPVNTDTLLEVIKVIRSYGVSFNPRKP